MDVQPFNRDGGEQFSTFDSREFLDHEDSASLDNIGAFSDTGIFGWNSDFVGDLNEYDLIQNITSDADSPNQEPTCNEEIQKIVNEWQNLLATDPAVNEPTTSCQEQDMKPQIDNLKIDDDSDDEFKEILNSPNSEAFDLTSYIIEDPQSDQSTIKKELPGIKEEYVTTDSHKTEPISQSITDLHAKKRKAPVKKIDMKAHRYIIDESEECEIDIETISENSPVLEAGDLNSLLEQFEATELPETLAAPDSKTDDLTKINLTDKTSRKRCGTIENNQNIYPTRRKQLDASIKNKKLLKNKGTSLLRKKGNMKADIKNKNGCGCPEDNCKVNCKVKTLTNGHRSDSTKSKMNGTLTSAKTQEPQKILLHSPVQTLEPEKMPLNKSTSANKPDQMKSKQTLKDVPYELLERMKESGKRKPISVIPAIPSKKIRSERNLKVQSTMTKFPETLKIKDELLTKNKQLNDIKPISRTELVLNEHNYCLRIDIEMELEIKINMYDQVIKKEIKQEPEFFMNIEDKTPQVKQEPDEDKKPIICKQPMVKNADGKMMVSLLKANTIRTSGNEGQKRKLNLEEYKKRRKGLLKIPSSSPQTSSPSDSNSNSPVPEDEEVRRMKHQQKLMQMALEVLNTPPKSEKKPDKVLLEVAAPPPPVQLPADMETKTLVSIGSNTTFELRNNLDPLAPIEQLEEIKPLLEKVSDRISNNSLITSVIENIPKMIESCQPAHNNEEQPASKAEHGEDLTIIFLPKNRVMVETRTIGSQTNISLTQQTKESRYRRRSQHSSPSSRSSRSSRSERQKRSKRPRRESQTSCGSESSSRSSRSSNSRSTSSSSHTSGSSVSRSRSRSKSPKHTRQDRERLREVEERRVIYVGRLASNTTRDDLRRRFNIFGTITNISLHTRKHGDNYGFVTFANKLDAYQAIERGNNDPSLPKYDLSFGGRRIFCQTSYSDLDNVRDDSYHPVPRVVEDSFDRLLKEAQENMRKRKG